MPSSTVPTNPPPPIIPLDISLELSYRLKITTPKTFMNMANKSLHEIRANNTYVITTCNTYSQTDIKQKPTLRSQIDAKLAFEVSRNIQTGLELLDLSKNSPAFIRPTLAYYGLIQCLGAISRTFFDWTGDAPTHGVSCLYKNATSADNTPLKLEESGSFQRIANTLAILTNTFNLFSDREDDVPIVIQSQNITSKHPKVMMPKLSDLAEYDLTKIGNTIPSDIANQYSASSSAFLIDLLIIFCAGSLCRYKPIWWRDTISGEKTEINTPIEIAISDMNHYIVILIYKILTQPNIRIESFLPKNTINPFVVRSSGLK
jgi:hypothetical protein